MAEAIFRSGMLIFPNLTQLDLTGPYEILSRMPGSEVLLIWKSLDPVRTEHGLTILPTATFDSCVAARFGAGPRRRPHQPAARGLGDPLAFLLRRAAASARYVVSVCTGALVLGAAGLLRGRRATTHWMSRDLLAAFGATPVAERVVVDGNLFTGGGVTAGIDVALSVAAEIAGRAPQQEAIQLAKSNTTRRRRRRLAKAPRRRCAKQCWRAAPPAEGRAEAQSPLPPRRYEIGIGLRSESVRAFGACRLAAGGGRVRRHLRASASRNL